MTERLQDLWPSLTSMDQRQIVNPDRDDPDWMRDFSPAERDIIRRESEKELEMMEREAKRRSDGGHPNKGDEINYRSEIAKRRAEIAEGRE